MAEVERRDRELSERLGVTREAVVRKLWGAYEEARRQSNPALAILAIREIATILGFYPDCQPRGIARELRKAAGRRAAPRRKDLMAMSDAELVELAESDVALEDEPLSSNED